MTYTNYESKGSNSVQDNDLCTMELNYGKHLPWLGGLLGEIQFLRNGAISSDNPRIKYLESVLNELEVSYEDE